MNEHAFETLSPKNAALLLIDHQVGTMNFWISDIIALELKNETLLLEEAARAFGIYAVMDASSTFSQHALMASMFRMSQAGVKIANATMVVAEMLADWSGKYAHPVGEILARRA